MIRIACIALALAGTLAGTLATAAPAAADVVVKFGPAYRPPAVVVRPAPVWVAPRAVVVAPAPVVVRPAPVVACRTVQQKTVVRKPNGATVVSYQPVRVCR